MSVVTMAQLLSANPEPFHRAAVAWAALAEEIDNAYERFIHGVKQVDSGLPSGAAAAAAIQKLTRQGRELSNAHNPARRIADALERHAYAVGDLRLAAEQTIFEAMKNGFSVDRTTAVVSAPPERFQLGEAPVTARAITRVVNELHELLSRAGMLDDLTAAAIQTNLPAPGSGFSDQPSPYVFRDTVAQQRGRSAKDVQAWWQSLNPEQQEQVLRDHPDLVGWLNGVPATDRDRANRFNLDNQLSGLESREAVLNSQIAATQHAYYDALATNRGAADVYQHRLGELTAELQRVQTEEAGLRRVRDKLADLGGAALLIGIDGTGDGKVVISMGDPDRAAHTAVFVPGVNTDLLDVGGDMDRVRNLQVAADQLTPTVEDVAVVYWLGYDTPKFDNAIGHGASREGAAAFTPFVDGLLATHQLSNDLYHVSAVGHSYGTTVIAESAIAGGLQVDDIVTAGSPGMHTDRAENLHMDPRHVWGGLAVDDHIGGGLGDLPFIHGQEPTDPAFGANRYEVDTQGHSAYWTPGTASLRNQAYIIVGQYDHVGYYHGSPPES